MFAGTVPPPRKREVDPRHDCRPTPPLFAAADFVEVTVVAKINWHYDGDMDFKMSPEELDEGAAGDARVVYTYPGGEDPIGGVALQL